MDYDTPKNLTMAIHKSSMDTSQGNPEYSEISNLMVIRDLKLKIGNILASFSLVLCICIAIFNSIFHNESQILTFIYHKNEKDYNTYENQFIINLYMLYIYLFTILITNIALIHLLITEKDTMVLKIIYTDLGWLFFISQLFLSIPFFLGVLISKNFTLLLFSVSSEIFMITWIILYYKNIKEKKNLSFLAFITLYNYTSNTFCFIVHMTSNNICQIIAKVLIDNGLTSKMIQNTLSISTYTTQIIIALILITYYRDVIYSITLAYFLISYLTGAFLTNEEKISIYVIVTFNCISVLITILKFRMKTIGYEDESKINEILEARATHKKSSWFSYN